MSSYYGLLFPEYWDGPSGKLIQKLGGVNATLLGAYLMANRRANMIGLYRLPLDEIRLPMKESRLVAAFSVLSDPTIRFAEYDLGTEFVWVREMARIRMGLRNRSDVLNPSDNRVDGINKLYQQVDDNPFLGAFFERYRKTLHLKKQRTCEHYPHISPLERGLEGASKPVNRSDNRDQDQSTGTDQGRSALTRRETRTAPGANGNTTSVLRKLVQDIQREHPDWQDSDVRDEAKTRAARAHIPYTGHQIAEAMDLASALRATS
jgi:hypothetical protein